MGRRFEDGVEGRTTAAACKCVVELRKLIRKKPTSFTTRHSPCGASAIGSAPRQDPGLLDITELWSTRVDALSGERYVPTMPGHTACTCQRLGTGEYNAFSFLSVTDCPTSLTANVQS